MASYAPLLTNRSSRHHLRTLPWRESGRPPVQASVEESEDSGSNQPVTGGRRVGPGRRHR
jgi:hypothetical protein